MANKYGKVLIIYYSFSGITKSVAEQLQQLTEGDLWEVKTVKTYSSYDACVKEAKAELETGRLPQLQESAPDLSAYELVLVGGPVWWYTLATPVMNLLKAADFAGKRAATFCTHAGGVGQTLPDFQTQAKNARVLKGLDLYNPHRQSEDQLNKILISWLDSLC